MPIDGQTQEKPQTTCLYLCCKLGFDNKIGVAGFRFLREEVATFFCNEEYKEEDEDDL